MCKLRKQVINIRNNWQGNSEVKISGRENTKIVFMLVHIFARNVSVYVKPRRRRPPFHATCFVQHIAAAKSVCFLR